MLHLRPEGESGSGGGSESGGDPHSFASCFTVHSSGLTAALGVSNGTLEVLNVATRQQLLRQPRPHEGRSTPQRPTAMLLLDGADGGSGSGAGPHAQLLLVGWSDGKVEMLDLRSGSVVRQLVAHSGCVESMAPGPAGSAVVTAGRDGSVRVWDIRSMTAAQDLPVRGKARLHAHC